MIFKIICIFKVYGDKSYFAVIKFKEKYVGLIRKHKMFICKNIIILKFIIKFVFDLPE